MISIRRLAGLPSRLIADHLPVVDFAHPALVDEQVRVADQPVDLPLAALVLGAQAHARINPKTSSRFSSMCWRETSDSRLRRSSGSVLEGRTLKCHSG